jgi:O-antigen ligase
MSLPVRMSSGSETKQSRLGPGVTWGLIIVGVGLGIAVAYLVVAGDWPIALGLGLALPGIILLHRYPFLGLIIWLALAPFLMTTQTEMLRRMYWVIHRALPVAAVGLIVLSSMLGIRRRKLPKLSWAELAMAGYLVVSQFSIVYLSNDVMATTFHLYDRVFIPMCLYLLIRLSAPDERDLRRLMPIVFFVCASQSMIGILSWVAPGLLPSMWVEQYVGERTIGSLVNPGTYTIVLIFSGLLLLHAGLNRKPGLVRTLYVSAFVVACLCVFLSFTRSSWLGGVAVILGLVFLYPKFMIRLSLVSVLAVAVLGAGLLASQFTRANERLTSEQAEESALSRLPIYYAAFRMVEAKPLFGWGYGNFDRFDRQFQGRVLDLVNPDKDHASHNVYLSIGAEQGIIGLSLFLAPMLWWLVLSLRVLPKMPREGFWSRKLLIVLWLIILFQVIVSNFFNVYVVVGLGIWWVTLGLIGSVVQAYLKPAESASPAHVHPETSGREVESRGHLAIEPMASDLKGEPGE